jgi:hypothetical protein
MNMIGKNVHNSEKCFLVSITLMYYDKVPKTKKLFSLFGSIWNIWILRLVSLFCTVLTLKRQKSENSELLQMLPKENNTLHNTESVRSMVIVRVEYVPPQTVPRTSHSSFDVVPINLELCM